MDVNDRSRDGRYVLYSKTDLKTKSDSLDFWPPRPCSSTSQHSVWHRILTKSRASFLPILAAFAYTSGETGRAEVYVRAFPGPSGARGRWSVSIEGGAQPRWRREGRELFYRSPDRTFFAVDVTPIGQVSKRGIPRALFTIPVSIRVSSGSHRYDMTADGTRFILYADMGEAASVPITVVLTWTAWLEHNPM